MAIPTWWKGTPEEWAKVVAYRKKLIAAQVKSLNTLPRPESVTPNQKAPLDSKDFPKP